MQQLYVKPWTDCFKNLNNDPKIILQDNHDRLRINLITVANVSGRGIRLNVLLKQNPQKESYIYHNYLIQPNATLFLIGGKNMIINLEVFDSLTFWSDAEYNRFDVTVDADILYDQKKDK